MSEQGSTPLLDTGEGALYGRRGLVNGWLRPCVVEGVGTALFVTVGTLAGVASGNDLAAVGLAHGLTIALLVIGMGHISGGHFNPAVTLGATLAGAIKPLLGIAYVGSQLFGSIFGAAITRGCCAKGYLKELYVEGYGGAQVLNSDEVSAGSGILCEATLTIVLVLTVLMAAVDSDGQNILAPLAIGFAVTADIFAGANVTGASMNPARSFGPAVVVTSLAKDDLWKHHYVYWIGPVIGGLIAGALYRFLLARNEKRVILKTD